MDVPKSTVIQDGPSIEQTATGQHGLLNAKPASSSPAIQDGPSIEQTALLVAFKDESALSTKCQKCMTSMTSVTSRALRRYKTMTCTCMKQNVVEEKCLSTNTFGRTQFGKQ
jgi:hypothetical protein